MSEQAAQHAECLAQRRRLGVDVAAAAAVASIALAFVWGDVGGFAFVPGALATLYYVCRR